LGANGANERGWPWWIWVLLTPFVILLGLWGLRRTQILGPAAFTPELPPIIYERMQRWAERLGLRAALSDTPYEQARLFGRILPEGRVLIQRITELYVYYRFSRQSAQPNLAEASNTAASAAGESWQQLQPILWQAWLRRLANRLLRRRTNSFGLMSDK
jgi:hypothetical protein